MHDRIYALWNLCENRMFGGVLNFQEESGSQSVTGSEPLEYRVRPYRFLEYWLYDEFVWIIPDARPWMQVDHRRVYLGTTYGRTSAAVNLGVLNI